MIFSILPSVRFFVVTNQSGQILTVRRGMYTGLPGGIARENETADMCGLRIIRNIGLPTRIGHQCVHLEQFEDNWDDVRSTIVIYGFLKVYIMCIRDALWTCLNDTNVRFDITVEAYRRFLVSSPAMVA